MPQAVCVCRKTKKKIPPPSKHTHQNHSSTAVAADPRRRATKQVPRARLSSLASSDARFVEIGHVQLSQSMTLPKNADRHYTTNTLTDRLLQYLKPICTPVRRFCFGQGQKMASLKYRGSSCLGDAGNPRIENLNS